MNIGATPLADTCEITQVVENETWKTSPKLRSCLALADLTEAIVRVAPSACIGHVFLVNAAKGCHQRRACLFQRDTGFASCLVSFAIRKITAKFRAIKACTQSRSRLFDKATPEESARLQRVLDVMVLEDSLWGSFVRLACSTRYV